MSDPLADLFLYVIRNTVDKSGLTTSLVTVSDMAESNLYCDLRFMSVSDKEMEKLHFFTGRGEFPLSGRAADG